MEHILTAALNELKEELDEKVDATTEPSRFMRLMHLKYKCFLIFLLTLAIVLLIVYLTVTAILHDAEMGVIMTEMFEHYKQLRSYNVSNVTAG